MAYAPHSARSTPITADCPSTVDGNANATIAALHEFVVGCHVGLGHTRTGGKKREQSPRVV